jgi:hypothetical protein
MDFAVHRRFRRDLFIRSGRHTEPVVRAEQLAPLMVGCLEDPAAIAEHIDVPRGRITFDSRFIHELGGVMADGSAAIPQLVDALARVPGDRPGIVRNLLYLIAAGQLTPFARGRRSTVDCRRPRFTSPTIRKMVNRVATSGGSGWIASQASGGGIKMDHTEARAVVDYVHRERPLRCPPTSQVERLLRLGILV